MDSGQLLGSLEVEVKANLDKLVADFARGRTQTQAFANDMQKVTRASKLSAAEQLNLSNAYNSLIKTYDPLKDKMGRYMADAESIRRINASGLFNTKELDRLNQGFSTLAPKSAQTAAGFRTAAGDAAALKMQLGGLVEKYNPLQVAQGKYAQEVALVQKAQAAGLIGQSEAIALQGAMGRAFQDTEKKIEGETVGLEGWARSTEHHVRAMRLLYSFIGGEVVKSLAEFSIKTLEATASIKDQSDQLGITSTQLQEYKAIAGQVGMSADDMAGAFNALNHNIAELELHKGQKQLSDFGKIAKDLGVNITDAAGKVRDKTEIFNDFIDKLGQVGDQAQRQAAQMIVFGEAGGKMGQLVQGGSAHIRELREAVQQLGIVMSDADIARADEVSNKLKMLWTVLGAQIAQTVVNNAESIERLATALTSLLSMSLGRFVSEIGALADRLAQLAGTLNSVRNALQNLPVFGNKDVFGQTDQVSNMVGGYGIGRQRSTGLIGRALHALPDSVQQMLDAYGVEPAQQKSITVKLPAAREAPKQPKGPNIDLTGSLAHHGSEHPKKEKFDEYEQDLEQETLRQLQLKRDQTGSLIEQNEIDHQIADLNLKIRDQQIDKQVHGGQLTKKEGEALKKQAEITTSLEKEAADRKMRIAVIEQQAQYDSELAQLTQDGLQTAKALARTDADRKKYDAAILDSKQQQAKLELQKQIELEKELPHPNLTRIAELEVELQQLIQNQIQEWKAFNLEHLTAMQAYIKGLPTNQAEFSDKIQSMAFDQFNQNLQDAAQEAQDVGDAFGQLADDILHGKNPKEILSNFISNIAATLNKNVIEKPISDWATKAIGLPLAKQTFGSKLDKLSQEAGATALTTNQMNTALATATGSLGALQAAAQSAAASLATVQATGGGGGGGAGSILGSLLGGGGGGGGDGLDLGSFLLDNSGGDMTDAILGPDLLGSGMYGFASGGYTGNGNPGDVKGMVHAGEFVMSAGATSAIGLPVLSSLNAGSNPFTTGGLTSYAAPPPQAGGGGDMAAAAAMLMKAAHALLDAAKAMKGGGGGGKSGLLGGLLGIVAGGLLGSKGGGLGGMLGGLLKGGGGAAAAGGGADGGMMDAILGSGMAGFDSGGFTGWGADNDIAGVVHKNEWVWDAPTTKRHWPLLSMLNANSIPDLGPGLGINQRLANGPQPLSIHFGQLVFPGVTDARTARQSAAQAVGTIHRNLGKVIRQGTSGSPS